MTRQRIVVGVDGSPGAGAALLWAADECRIRSCTLLVVHCVDERRLRSAAAPAGDDYSVSAERLLSRHAQAASSRAPGVPVTILRVADPAAESLIELSTSAALVVVGTRGHGGFARSMLGSVSTRTATHAQCPVAVIPQLPPPTIGAGVVVVGAADGSAARLAARFGREEARLRAAVLREVHSDGDPAADLLLAAEEAHLLVLGCHHSEERWSTRLGPVAATVLHSCPCPVVVVGADPDELVEAVAGVAIGER